MGKRHCDQEQSKLQRLAFENKKLRREIATLRKQLARIDLDRYPQVKELVEKHEESDSSDGHRFLEKIKEEWKCNQCNEGYLEIIIYSKLGNPWYLRKCNNCTNRTKAQKYTTEVKGIVKRDTTK